MKKTDILLVMAILQAIALVVFITTWALGLLPIGWLGLSAVSFLLAFSSSLYYWAWKNFEKP